jgi:hypothetical protein
MNDSMKSMADFLADFLKNNPEHPLLSRPFTVLNLPKALANRVANDQVANDRKDATIGSLCRVAAQFHKNVKIPGLGLQQSAVLRGILVRYIQQQMMLEAPAAVSEVPALDPEIRGKVTVLADIYEQLCPNRMLDWIKTNLEVNPERFEDLLTCGLLKMALEQQEKFLHNLQLKLFELLREKVKKA